MQIDKKLDTLPLTKTNPGYLKTFFGTTEITPMWVADLEFPIAAPIQEALIKRITDSGFAYEYKPESYFTAQKSWYLNQYGIDLERDQVLYSPSITTTIAAVIDSFSNEGDGIIIQPPVFMEFRSVIHKTGRKLVKNPLKLRDKQYEIDFEDLEKKAKIEKNKILILCNPHNPVGRVWKRSELEKIMEISKKHNLIVISDEIHKDITLFGHQFNSILQLKDRFDNLVIATSEAKTFNLPSISDSMAIIPNEEIRKTVSALFSRYNLGGTNALTRVALEAAYNEGEHWLKQVVNTIEKNVSIIEQELKDTSVNLIKPEGTYQVWLDFRNIFKNTKTMFSHLTENSKIGMNAGHWFGREGALFARMNIGTSNEKVQMAIRKIKAAVDGI